MDPIAPTLLSPAKPSTAPVNSPAISSDFETFLRMLTAQMQNQDPLDPVDSADYAVQLATFSSVEQQVRTNDLLTALTGLVGGSGLAEHAGWVGMEARVAAPAFLDGSPISVALPPPNGTGPRELVVRNEAGNEVDRRRIPDGQDTLTWRGVDASGRSYLSGLYTFDVEAPGSDGAVVSRAAETYARISEVRSGPEGVAIVLPGGVIAPAASVAALRETP